MDRLDIHIEVPAVPVKDLSGTYPSESSEHIRQRVIQARERQVNRYQQEKTLNNAQLKPRLVKKHCSLSEAGRLLLEQAVGKLGLSARAYGRVLRVSRTIADLAQSEAIQPPHLAEAIQYRTLDRPLSS